jgi:hypothetical protein
MPTKNPELRKFHWQQQNRMYQKPERTKPKLTISRKCLKCRREFDAEKGMFMCGTRCRGNESNAWSDKDENEIKLQHEAIKAKEGPWNAPKVLRRKPTVKPEELFPALFAA